MHEVITSKAARLGYTLNGKLHTIHVWSDDRTIAAARGKANPLIDRFGVRGKFVVEYSGNMGRFHDMESIMEAAELLKDNNDIVFLFVGEGHKKRWMMDFAKERHLSNCQFCTYVPREELGLLLSLADVGLVSLVEGQEGLSVPSKTFGMMAAGVPIIAVLSDRSEIARIIKEEQCGTVVGPGESRSLADAILAFYRDRSKCRMAGQRSERVIRDKYNLRGAARAYQALLAEIAQSNDRGAERKGV